MEEFSTEIMEINDSVHLQEEEPLEENLEKLEGCVEKLDGEQRACVKLFFLKEKCYKEIVDLTGFDLKKVKSYIQNGKRNLQICMKKDA